MQVGFGAQFGNAPTRKLAQERAAKALPILEASASARDIAVPGMGQVDEFQPSGAPTEAFDLQFQAGAMLGMNRAQTPHQIAGFAPNLERDGLAPPLQLEVVRTDRNRVVAGVEHGWSAAGF